MAAHFSILAWRIPKTEEPGGLQSMGSQGVGHDCMTNFHFLCVDLYVCVLVTQSYLTLCDPMDCSPPGSSVHGIL